MKFLTLSLSRKLRKLRICILALCIIFSSLIPVNAKADITTGLLGHWGFEEGTGASTADSSGNSHTGTVGSGTSWQQGRIGDYSLEFDGVIGHVSLANASTLDSSTYTISMWINGDTGFSGTVFRLTNSSSNAIARSKYEIQVTPTNIVFINGNGSDSSDSDTFSTTLTAGSWWHIACTLDDNGIKACFRNGTLISTATLDIDISTNIPGAALIGTARALEGNNRFFEGLIDDVRVYNRDLSESDIQELFALGADTTDPSVPANLSVTSSSAANVALSWDASTDNVGVTGYKVFRDSVQIDTTTETTYIDTGLSVNTTYSYTVSAYDQEGNESNQSTPVEATTATNTFEVIPEGGGDYTTISACVEDTQPGDICNVHAGTYLETLTPTNSGTYAYPILIQANGNDIVNLTGVNFDSVDFVHIKDINVETISQWGIEWTFDDYYQIGLFANSIDYWVLGPVTIDQISPDFDGSSNGWQVNPAVTDEQGFDSRRVATFNADLVPSLPYTSNASTESIVKTISAEQEERSYIQTASVLTVVPSIPENNGSTIFRPPYMGTDKPYYSTDDLRTDLLPTLTSVGTPPSLETVADRFKYLRLEHITVHQRSIRPIDAYGDTGTDGYGPQVTQHNAEDILRLFLSDSTSDKLPALIKVSQHGIDVAHSVIGGYRYSVGDGHEPNIALMAAFGATMLDIDEAKEILESATGFEEDLFTTSGVGGRVLWGSDNSTESQYWTYVISGDGNRAHKDPYGFIDGGSLDRSGYQEILSQSYKGSALVANLLPEIATTAWNPDEISILSRYAESWVNTGFRTQPDPCAPFDGNPANEGLTYGPDPENPGMCILDTDLQYYNSPTDFACQDGQQCGRFPEYHGTSADGGQYKSAFVASMWNAYYDEYTQNPDPDPDPEPDPPPTPSISTTQRRSFFALSGPISLSNTLVSQIRLLISKLAEQITLLGGTPTLELAPVTPTPTIPTTFSFTRNLQLYDTGEDVRALQRFLNSQGFLIAPVPAPGSPGNETTTFGPATYQALTRYQASVNLPSTGYFGPLTRGYIEGR